MLIANSISATLVEYSCSGQNTSPTFVGDNLTASLITVDGSANAGSFGLAARNVADPFGVPGRISLSTGTLTPLDGGHASFSFTLTSADPYALSFDHISFDHYEDWFNANGGWPGINLIIQQGTDAPLLLHDVPLNHSVYWDTGAHHWDTFSLPLNINHLNGPTSFTIIEGNSGQYGSPVIHIQNLSISGTSLSSVPEPSTYALFGLGALALVIAYRRKVA